MLNRPIPTSAILSATPPTEEKPDFDLREKVSFLWRHWIFIASIVGAALFVAAVYLFYATPRYTATAQVLLETQREKAGKDDPILSEVTLDFAMFASQLAIIKSTVFLQRVVEKVGLVSDPEFGSPSPQAQQGQQAPSLFEEIRSALVGLVPDSEVGSPPPQAQKSQQAPSLFSRIRTAFAGRAAPPAPPAPENEAVSSRVMSAVEAVKRATMAARAGQGYVLAISVTSVDPARAAKLANAIADSYVVEKLDARFDAAKRASAWLSDRLDELRRQLRESEEAVAQFRSDHGFVQTSANVTLTQQQLSELNASVVAARTDVAQKKARVDLLHAILDQGGNIQSLPDSPSSPVLQSLKQQEIVLSEKEADLARHYTDRHPLVVNARGALADVQHAIVEETKRIVANVDNEYALAKAKSDALERSVREATGQSGIDDKTAITLRELERTAAVNKSLFEDFLQRAKITQQQSTFEARDARVITPAMSPDAPSYPKVGRVVILAVALGLFIGIGSAIAKDMLNNGFATQRQIEDMLQLPLLASVNLLGSKDLKVKGSNVRLPLYPRVLPLSRYSEAIRTLRSGIQMTDVDNPPKIIQVTSTIPNEGKTTIALSLAISAANSGLKVLFVDTDLRHNSATHFFGLLKVQGLVDVLLGNVSAQDVITFSNETKIWVLPSGSKTRNPGDLLGSERMKSLIEACKESFDLIVADSPPVGPVVDPVVLAQLADTVVYVVRWASTSRELIHQSIRRLPEDKMAGVVFNLVNEKSAQKYGKYASQYYHEARSFKKYYEG